MVYTHFFRVIPFRLLGYGFPFAEAMFFTLEESHWVIDMAYSISGAFILTHIMADAFYTLVETNNLFSGINAGFWTMVWEVSASILLPSILVNWICSLVYKFTSQEIWFMPSLIGLLSLPIIVIPIDSLMDSIFQLIVHPIAHVVTF